MNRPRLFGTLLASLRCEGSGTPEVRELIVYGCLTRMHVVRLLAPALEGEDHCKDIDFSPAGIKARWEAGSANTAATLESAPWNGDFDPIEGFILHEAGTGALP